MKVYAVALIAMLICTSEAHAQQSFLRIPLNLPDEAYQLDIPLDHGVRWTDDSLTVPATPALEARLAASSIRFRKTSEHKAQAAAREVDACGRPARLDASAPAGWTFGSLPNGYYTLDDVWEAFAQMRARYPELISERMEVDTFRTYEGRALHYYRISDNPDVQEEEPRAFFNALHHAREPASLMQQIYFAWWLLERYETVDAARWLINNTELYLMPVVNPDGYAFNGGDGSAPLGFWRKNRRDNGNGTFGVDLNRNYPFNFGGAGSSSDPESDIYRGPSALSEPETQAVDFLHRQLVFTTVLNAHSFSDLVITPGRGVAGHELSDAMHAHLCWSMREDNRYGVGESLETVGYLAAGNSDDYFAHWDADNKPMALSFTPEIGDVTTGFRPSQSFMEGYLADAVLVNWRALQSVHPTLIVETQRDVLTQAGPYMMTLRNVSAHDVSTQLRVQTTSPGLSLLQDTFRVTVGRGEVQTVEVPYDLIDADLVEQSSLVADFPMLPHVLPYEQQLERAVIDELLIDERFDGATNVFDEETIATNVAAHPQAIGSNGELSFGVSAPFDLVKSSDVEIVYYHDFALESNEEDVSLFITKDLDPDEVYCTTTTSSLVGGSQPSFWGATPTFTEDRVVVKDLPAGQYLFGWSFSDISPIEQFLVDDVRVRRLKPLVVSSTGEANSDPEALRVWPSPASTSLTVVGAEPGAVVRAIDMIGRSFLLPVLGDSTYSVAHLRTGSYLVVASSPSGKVKQARLIVKRT